METIRFNTSKVSDTSFDVIVQYASTYLDIFVYLLETVYCL